MTIAQTWVECDGYGTPINDDMSVLDFGNITRGTTVTKYIKLRYMGCSSTAIKVWMDGAYADIYPYNADTPVSYEVDVTSAPYNIIIYGKLVQNDVGLVFAPGDEMPDKTNPLIFAEDVSANYATDGYSTQVLAIQISIPDTDTVDDCEYRGLRLMLCYDTMQG